MPIKAISKDNIVIDRNYVRRNSSNFRQYTTKISLFSLASSSATDINNNQHNHDNEETTNENHTHPTPLLHSSFKFSNHKNGRMNFYFYRIEIFFLNKIDKFLLVSSASPKTNNNDELVVDNDRSEDDEVARSFDINKWLQEASRTILNPSNTDDTVTSTQSPPRSKKQGSSRRDQQSPSPSSADNLYKPPFGPKKNDPEPATETQNTSNNNEVDDFFS